MANLYVVMRANPVFAIWLGVLGVGVVIAMAAFEMNEHARQLIADTRLALDRSQNSIDFSSRCAQMPQCKLSDQLRGASPFTSLWRLFAADDLHASTFEDEYLALRARRRGLMLVRVDLGSLITKLDELVRALPKPMAKAVLPDSQSERASA